MTKKPSHGEFMFTKVATGFIVLLTLATFILVINNSDEGGQSIKISPTSTIAPTFIPTAIPATVFVPAKPLARPTDIYGTLPCIDRYATPQEILAALNQYRNVHNAGNLVWNEKLAEVARMRVSQTLENGRDRHQGFIDFTNNNENFRKVGFGVLSENIGTACPLQAVHLIEWKIAKSPAHDAAQRDPSWQAVGIATSQGVTSFIFGKDPL